MSRYCNFLDDMCDLTETQCRSRPAIICHNKREKLNKEKEKESEKISGIIDPDGCEL